MPSNCGAGEDSRESPWTARRSHQSVLREINPEYHWKDWCWRWSSSILVTWCKQLTHWKSPWCWERLRAEGKEGVRGWDGWMASPMQWTWTWANFRRWWGTGRLGVLQFTGSQRVGQGINHKRVCQYIITCRGVFYTHQGKMHDVCPMFSSKSKPFELQEAIV